MRTIVLCVTQHKRGHNVGTYVPWNFFRDRIFKVKTFWTVWKVLKKRILLLCWRTRLNRCRRIWKRGHGTGFGRKLNFTLRPERRARRPYLATNCNSSYYSLVIVNLHPNEFSLDLWSAPFMSGHFSVLERDTFVLLQLFIYCRYRVTTIYY